MKFTCWDFTNNHTRAIESNETKAGESKGLKITKRNNIPFPYFPLFFRNASLLYVM